MFAFSLKLTRLMTLTSIIYRYLNSNYYVAFHLQVPVQPSDWYRCMYTPVAWTSFMERCYNAYIQVRCFEENH